MSRAGARDQVMLLALVTSFFFHLSMVTVFRIVIYFPQKPIEYYDLSIVEAPRPAAFTESIGDSLEIPSSIDASNRFAQPDAPVDRWAALPPVTLPTLNFSSLDLVRLSQSGLNTRSRYEELFEDEADDLWARFGRKLSTVGDLFQGSDTDTEAGPGKSKRMLAGHPAPGFAAYLEWMGEPYDRQPIVVQKIDALWGAQASILAEPIVLVARVNREGRVTFVQMPVEDSAGLVESSAQALFRYRFEPLLGDGPDIQHGTIIIQAEGSRP